jgi:hypothetical protein
LYFSWGWFLWFGFIFLMFSSLGNWGYNYRAHQRVGGAGIQFHRRGLEPEAHFEAVRFDALLPGNPCSNRWRSE